MRSKLSRNIPGNRTPEKGRFHIIRAEVELMCEHVTSCSLTAPFKNSIRVIWQITTNDLSEIFELVNIEQYVCSYLYIKFLLRWIQYNSAKQIHRNLQEVYSML